MQGELTCRKLNTLPELSVPSYFAMARTLQKYTGKNTPLAQYLIKTQEQPYSSKFSFILEPFYFITSKWQFTEYSGEEFGSGVKQA